MTKEEKTIKWRLGKLPTVEELRDLVKDKILTQDEARKILFSEETQAKKAKEELESEVKFLRELVDKLSEDRVSTVIKYVEHAYPTYRRYSWPYWTIGNIPIIDTSGSNVLCVGEIVGSNTTNFSILNNN